MKIKVNDFTTIHDGFKTGYVTEIKAPLICVDKKEVKYYNNLSTVRIMAVNVRGYETHDILIVAIMGGMNLEEHQKIRIFLKKDECNDLKMLTIANQFYLKLVKYRQQLKKKVFDKHIYKAYNEVAEVERLVGSTPFCGVKQLYIKKRKHPMTVLRSPRKGYKEIKSDTLRLWLRDEIIRKEKELYKERIEKGE
jgi:hypothetical protein